MQEERTHHMLKKVFGELKMSWPVVIILAVAMGAYTALMALLVPSSSSFHDIAVYLDGWILPAIIIITNCKKPLEAALKTFVFFLISQPLVYLIQVPFNQQGWGIFGFYKYWFLITLLTFPGAFIGWFIKKDNIFAGFILSVMLVVLAYDGASYAYQQLTEFPHHLLSAIFCFAMIPVLIFGVLDNKKAKIAASVIAVLATAACCYKFFSVKATIMGGNVLFDDTEKYSIDSSWTAEAEDESISKAWIEEAPGGGSQLMMEFYKPDPNKVVLSDGEGNEYTITVQLNEDKNIVVDE